jgi:hypothetical protein
VGHKEALLQSDQGWNGSPHDHYPAGRPQLTMIKLTIAPQSALPCHTRWVYF